MASRIAPLLRWVVRLLPGSDEPRFVAAVVAAAFVWGHAIVLASDRPMPLWQMARDGLALSLFLMPFFFIAVARAAWFMPRWVALPTITAAGLAPVLGHRLVAAGITSPLITGVLLGFIAAVFLVARWLEKKHATRIG